MCLIFPSNEPVICDNFCCDNFLSQYFLFRFFRLDIRYSLAGITAYPHFMRIAYFNLFEKYIFLKANKDTVLEFISTV